MISSLSDVQTYRVDVCNANGSAVEVQTGRERITCPIGVSIGVTEFHTHFIVQILTDFIVRCGLRFSRKESEGRAVAPFIGDATRGFTQRLGEGVVALLGEGTDFED